MDIKNAVKKFIEENLAADRANPEIRMDEPLFRGLLDSTDILRLVVFLESEWGIKVDDRELVPENFDTVTTVAAFVERKRK